MEFAEDQNVIYEGIIVLLIIVVMIQKIKNDRCKPKGRITQFSELFELTEKESEILEMIIKGLTSKEMGDKLFISEHTIKKHRQNIHRKCDVRNALELFRKVLNTN